MEVFIRMSECVTMVMNVSILMCVRVNVHVCEHVKLMYISVSYCPSVYVCILEHLFLCINVMNFMVNVSILICEYDYDAVYECLIPGELYMMGLYENVCE